MASTNLVHVQQCTFFVPRNMCSTVNCIVYIEIMYCNVLYYNLYLACSRLWCGIWRHSDTPRFQGLSEFSKPLVILEAKSSQVAPEQDCSNTIYGNSETHQDAEGDLDLKHSTDKEVVRVEYSGSCKTTRNG